MLRTLAVKPKLALDCALDYRVSREAMSESVKPAMVQRAPPLLRANQLRNSGISERASTVTVPLSRLHPLEEVHRKHDSHVRPGNSYPAPAVVQLSPVYAMPEATQGAGLPCSRPLRKKYTASCHNGSTRPSGNQRKILIKT